MVWGLRGIAGPARSLACLGRLAVCDVRLVVWCGCLSRSVIFHYAVVLLFNIVAGHRDA